MIPALSFPTTGKAPLYKTVPIHYPLPPAYDLPLQPITCISECLFYRLNDIIPYVPCYGTKAPNTHGVNDSVSLQRMRGVTTELAMLFAGLVWPSAGLV